MNTWFNFKWNSSEFRVLFAFHTNVQMWLVRFDFTGAHVICNCTHAFSANTISLAKINYQLKVFLHKNLLFYTYWKHQENTLFMIKSPIYYRFQSQYVPLTDILRYIRFGIPTPYNNFFTYFISMMTHRLTNVWIFNKNCTNTKV